MNWQETCRVIPEGVQTLSKRPCCHVEGSYPNYLVKGEGCYVWGDNGKRYIDFPCSLGANILGHVNQKVTEAVRDRIFKGTLFSLSSPEETRLINLISVLIPSMEMVRFLKTGSEACSAAVKIARAYTGREYIVCAGYHGWLEWYNHTTPKNAGSVKQDVTRVEWGDIQALHKAFERKPAGLIIEPYIYADENTVSKWLKECRRLCSTNGSVLIFDENVTGMRTKKLVAQNYWKVYPDLTCLGKAMANGFPMACVGGKREIMQVLERDCFVSSTFGGDLVGITAATETLNILKQSATIEHIWQMGAKLKTSFNQAASSLMMHEVKCIGLPPRTHFVFPTSNHLGLFWERCIENNVLFGHAQFTCFAHKQYEIDLACSAARDALRWVKKNWDDPLKSLKGQPPIETLRGLATTKEPMPIPKEIIEAKPDAIVFVAQEPPEQPKPKRGRPKGSRNKPK